LSSQEVGADIVQLLLGQPLSGEGELQNGHRRGAVIDHDRRLCPGGKKAQDRLGSGGNLRRCAIDIGAGLKEYTDNRLSIDRGRFDMLNVVRNGRHETFEYGRDPAFHLFRVQPRVSEGHSDHRDVDVGKDVGRRTQNYDRAQNEDQQREDDECIWAPQGDSDDPHIGSDAGCSGQDSGSSCMIETGLSHDIPAKICP
jgi:hypothetical protein